MDPNHTHAVDQCYRLLALCARAEAHPAMDGELTRQVPAFTAWTELPAQAELHGMGPLLRHLRKRVQIEIPEESKRVLDGVYLRHRRWNQAHSEVLIEITSLFEKAAKKRDDLAENRLTGAIGNATVGILPNGERYSWKAQTRRGHWVEESTFRVLRRMK